MLNQLRKNSYKNKINITQADSLHLDYQEKYLHYNHLAITIWKSLIVVNKCFMDLHNHIICNSQRIIKCNKTAILPKIYWLTTA